MSSTAHQWVASVLDDEACRLRPIDRHLLRELADWADHDGVCWPGTDTIARRLGVHYDTVGRARRRLVELGYLAYSPGSGRDTGLYRLLIPGRPDCPHPPRRRGPSTGATLRAGAEAPSAYARSTLRASADRTINEPVIEPRDDTPAAFTDAAGAAEWASQRPHMGQAVALARARYQSAD